MTWNDALCVCVFVCLCCCVLLFIDGDFSKTCSSWHHDTLQGVHLPPNGPGKNQGGELSLSLSLSLSLLHTNKKYNLTFIRWQLLTKLLPMPQKVTAGDYQSTREFTHDAEWILHNCIIYNGGTYVCTVCICWSLPSLSLPTLQLNMPSPKLRRVSSKSVKKM